MTRTQSDSKNKIRGLNFSVAGALVRIEPNDSWYCSDSSVQLGSDDDEVSSNMGRFASAIDPGTTAVAGTSDCERLRLGRENNWFQKRRAGLAVATKPCPRLMKRRWTLGNRNCL
jgi:hypothetical protein